MGISIIKIRRSSDRLIFIMGIPIPENTVLFWDGNPGVSRKEIGLYPPDYFVLSIRTVTIVQTIWVVDQQLLMKFSLYQELR